MSVGYPKASKEQILKALIQSLDHNIQRLSDNKNQETNKAKLYLVTTHLKEPPGSYGTSTEGYLDYVSSVIPKVYSHFLNKTVKNHDRKSQKKYHPYMMSFIDFVGSREHQNSFVQLPHIHSILVLHPETNLRFLELKSEGFRLIEKFENTSAIMDIDAIEIGPSDEDLDTVLDYSAKSYLMNFIPFVSKETQANMMVING